MTVDRVPSDEEILAFWSWFESVAAALETPGGYSPVVQELERHLGVLGDFAWELGPGESAASALTISPGGDPTRLHVTQRIVALAPAIAGWELHASRQKRTPALQFTFVEEDGERREVDASSWRYVLFRYPDGMVDLVLEQGNLKAMSEEDRQHAAFLVLDGLLTEAVRLLRISDVECVLSIPAEQARSANDLAVLEDHLTSLAGRGDDSAAHRKAWEGYFSSEVPQGWETEEEDGVITFFDPVAGVGALQFSFATRTDGGGVDLDDLIRRFLAQTKVVADAIPTVVGRLPARMAEGSDGTSWWRVWVCGSEKRVATLTYVCALLDDGRERVIVDELLASIEWADAPDVAAPMKPTALEVAVIDHVLAGEASPSPRWSTLRGDRVEVTDRRLTGAGFFAELARTEATRMFDDAVDLKLGHVGAKLATGEELGFILYVEGGYLVTIEGFSYSEDGWPTTLGTFEVYTADIQSPSRS